jgi:hypothetical protein
MFFGEGPMQKPGNKSKQDIVEYIATLTSELSRMASAARCPALANLLNAAQVEAEQLSNRMPHRPRQVGRMKNSAH